MQSVIESIYTREGLSVYECVQYVIFHVEHLVELWIDLSLEYVELSEYESLV